MFLYLKALWKLYKYRFVVRIDPPAIQHRKSIKPNGSLCTLFTHVASIHSIYPQVYNHEKQILIQSNRNKPRAQTGDRTKNLARHTKIWLQKTLGLNLSSITWEFNHILHLKTSSTMLSNNEKINES